jgi:hypothetical protein
MKQVWETAEQRTGFWWGYLKNRKKLWSPGPRQKGNIKVNLLDFGWDVQLDCCGSGWREVAGASEGDNTPSGSRKCENILTSWEKVSFWWRTLLHGVIYLVENNKYITGEKIKYSMVVNTKANLQKIWTRKVPNTFPGLFSPQTALFT